MIPAPSAAFAAEEARRQGAVPVLRAIIHPHYFRDGLAAGSGTFVNCSFVAPDRIQVDQGAASASWTSPVLRPAVGEYPTLITPTRSTDSPGYAPVVVEWRTARTTAALAAAAWSTLAGGAPVSIYDYFQWRGTWTKVRSWVFKNQMDMDNSAVWVRKTYDPAAPLQSYATKSGGDLAYLADNRFTGEFVLPPGDVKAWGTITLDAPLDFSDLSAADHTLRLLNRDSCYTPGHPNFIFAGETWWYRKSLRLEMGYQLPYGDFTERIILYDGTILKWGPAPHGVDQDGKYQEHYAEIYSRDVVAALLEQKVGVPDEAGNPRPLVMGTILRQAEQLGDETLGAPRRTAAFEAGTTGELAGVDAGGDGAVAVIGTEPYAGSYCLKTAASAAGAFAKGRLELPAASSTPLFTTYLRFVTVPDVPLDKNCHFLGLYDASGVEQVQFYVGADFRVWVLAGGNWKETDWYIDQDLGVYLRVSIGLCGANPGVLKLWVSGNEVLTWNQDDAGNPKDWSGYSLIGAFVGPHLAAAEAWEIHTDAWSFFDNYYPLLYRVPGGPYQSIDTIYSDGTIKLEKPLTPAVAASAPPPVFALSKGSYLATRYVGGTVQPDAVDNLTKVPAEGAVIFNDLANPPKGTLFFRLRKDDQVHPVDQIQAVLAAVGQDGKIATASFTAARAASPNDSLGCYFDNVTAGDAIKSLISRGLLLFTISGAQVKLQAYTGEAPVSAVLTLTEADLVNLEPAWDMEGLTPKVTVKWGWYERNHGLFKVLQDDEALRWLRPPEIPAAQYAPPTAELDYSWGNEVGSDNGDMARAKATLFLTRGKAARQRLTWAGFRNLVRLELGDTVQVNLPRLGAAANFGICGTTLRMDPPRGVDLRLVRFLGEN